LRECRSGSRRAKSGIEAAEAASRSWTELVVLRYNGAVPNVRVTFLPANQTFEFDPETLPYHEHGKPLSLLDVALNFGFQLEHACGGNCACTTCHVVVKEGTGNLSEMDDDEADRLDMAADLQLTSRLGCQCVVKGDVVVEIPAWNRNYVSEGGGSILGEAIPAGKRG
jgi:ferredoxin, 2Fe-2S